jgi:hypothetical protein
LEVVSVDEDTEEQQVESEFCPWATDTAPIATISKNSHGALLFN